MTTDSNKSASKAELVRARFTVRPTAANPAPTLTLANSEPALVEGGQAEVVNQLVPVTKDTEAEAIDVSINVSSTKRRGRPKKSDSVSTKKSGDSKDDKTFTIPVSGEAYKAIFDLALKKSSETGELWSPQKLVKSIISKALNIKI